MRMDNAPAYTEASGVMQAYRNPMGVRYVDLSAPDKPTHHSHAMVERCNQIMEKMLDVAISKL